MWFNAPFYKYATGTIFVLVILFLLIQLYPILEVIINFFVALIVPLIAAGLLFYIFRPLRDLLEKRGFRRVYSLAIVFLILFLSIFLIVLYIWPFFAAQISDFAASPQYKIEEVQRKTISFMNLFNYNELSTTELQEILNSYLYSILDWFSKDILGIVTNVTKIASFIIFTPIILFYLLKDSDHFEKSVIKLTPKPYRDATKIVLEDLDETLSIFISGQFTIAIFVGILLFIGYSLIGLPYALLLAMFALVFNMIPFIGTFISTIPALILGFSVNPLMCFKVILVVIAVHALDANLISPYVLGKKLKIHPLTIILLLLAAGSLWGITGLLLATPLYALLKTLLLALYEEREVVGLK